MASANNRAGRPRGAKNYKNEVLINIIASHLPNGQYSWDLVAKDYMTAAKEPIIRDTDDVKRHWVKILCNGMNKPTGETGGSNDRIHRCIAIERLILDKTHSAILGLSPPQQEGVTDSEDAIAGSEVNEDEGDDNSAAVPRFPSLNGPLLPPLLPPPPGVFEADFDDELTGIDTTITTRATPAEKMPQSLTAAARPESRNSTSATRKKNQKTKNSSNKNKDRTSIAGSISKLIDSLSSNTDDGEANVGKRMNMMMMQQLDSMDRRMERRDKKERKEKRRKKKKRQKKKRAKKRAKKHSRLLLDDGYTSSSGSGSSSSTSSSSSEGDSDSSSPNAQRKGGLGGTKVLLTADDGGGKWKYSAAELQEMQEYEEEEARAEAFHQAACDKDDYERDQFDRRGR